MIALWFVMMLIDCGHSFSPTINPIRTHICSANGYVTTPGLRGLVRRRRRQDFCEHFSDQTVRRTITKMTTTESINYNDPTESSSTDHSNSSWEVWKVIAVLKEASSFSTTTTQNDNFESPSHYLYPASKALVEKVAFILERLATDYDGSPEWQGILNKSTLLHEVEESILALHFLQEQMALFVEKDVVVVDACCGKGVFSLLCSYAFEDTESDKASVRKIVMLDKNPKLRWDHVPATNRHNHKNDNRRPTIECWPNFNLHEIDSVADRLANELVPTSYRITPVMAIVGIHLCKTLSPTCIGIVNALGPEKCPCLVLAPCCLPRTVVQSRHKPNASVEVRQHETPQQRESRNDAKLRRAAAMARPSTRGEQVGILAEGACWKCGQFGHQKADCPSDQTTGKPRLIQPPLLHLDVSTILHEENPFGAYCRLLATSIQRDRVMVQETSLTNSHGGKQKDQANNWNQDRKSIYIVAGGGSS